MLASAEFTLPVRLSMAGPEETSIRAKAMAVRQRLMAARPILRPPLVIPPPKVELRARDVQGPKWDQPEPTPYDHFTDAWQAVDPPAPRKPTVREIILSICKRHGVELREIRSTSRTKRIAYCRMECAYEIRSTVLIKGRMISLPEIARHLGGIDHTTVLYGIRKHAERNGLKVPK